MEVKGRSRAIKGSQAKTVSPNGSPLCMVLAKKESWGLKRWAHQPRDSLRRLEREARTGRRGRANPPGSPLCPNVLTTHSPSLPPKRATVCSF